MTRTEKYQDHETAIALAWLKESKRNLENGLPAFRLTNCFDAIVADWEESGKLRANHRKLDAVKCKQIAAQMLKHDPTWKIVLDYFIAPILQVGDDVEVTCDEWNQSELYFVSKRFKNGNLTLRSYCGNEAIRLNDRTRRKFQIKMASREQKLQTARALDAQATEESMYQRHNEAARLCQLATHLTA